MVNLPVQDSRLKLDEFLRVVDVATAIRLKQEQVDRHLDIDAAKAELKRKLRETAAVTGEKLTDFQIESAANSYFQGLYSFKEPKRDFGIRLAEAYINRARLFKNFVVKPLVVAACAGLCAAAAIGINNARLNAQEKGVEEAVEEAYQNRQALAVQSQLVSSSPIGADLPTFERDKLQEKLAGSWNKLAETKPFFDRYCSGGTSEDDVTRENFGAVQKGLPGVKTLIQEADSELKAGREIIMTQEGIVAVRRSLDSIIGEIRTLKPIEPFERKAETLYTSGLGEVERRNLPAAQQRNQELSGVREDIAKYSGLAEQTEVLYKGIKAVAKEPEALQKGEGLYKEARQFAEAADVPKMSQAVAQMQRLDRLLNQDYTIKIVNRPGVKSGQDRYYTDEKGRRVSGYYLIVEAIDSSGNALPMDITNEENSRTERVNMWGERVPNQVYERVKQDKMDNGIINNAVVGSKQKGYMTERFTMKDVTKQGQITRW